MLAKYPQAVRATRSRIFASSAIAMEKKYRWLSTQRPAPFAWQTQDLNASGAVGNATLASADKGERLIDHGAQRFIELLDDVDKFDVNTFSQASRSD